MHNQSDFDFSKKTNNSTLSVVDDLGEVIHYSFEEEQGVNSLVYGCENGIEIEEIHFYIPHSYFLSDEYAGDHVVETVKQPNKIEKTVEKH